MTEATPIGEISISGLRSIEKVTLSLTTDVTVLIGANGSGKSNLISAFELIARIWDNTFQTYLEQRGGLSSVLHSSAGYEAESVGLTVWGVSGEDSVRVGFSASLSPDDDDVAVLAEHLLIHDMAKYPRPYREFLGRGGISRARTLAEASDDSKMRRFAAHVEPLLAGCRVFHFDDVGPDSPVKGWSTVGDDVALRVDGENLAAYLYRIKHEDPRTYQRIVTAVQMVAPFFGDFVLVPSQAERIRLRWRQQGLDRVFLAREMSDGTLRFVCLATLLLAESRPSTIVLDEPELGLHPFAIQQLAELARASATGGHRVVMATQSVPLLAHFEVGEAAVLDRMDGSTVVQRPDEESLADFLAEYSLGALWEMNLLGGGRPNHAEASR